MFFMISLSGVFIKLEYFNKRIRISDSKGIFTEVMIYYAEEYLLNIIYLNL